MTPDDTAQPNAKESIEQKYFQHSVVNTTVDTPLEDNEDDVEVTPTSDQDDVAKINANSNSVNKSSVIDTSANESEKQEGNLVVFVFLIVNQRLKSSTNCSVRR